MAEENTTPTNQTDIDQVNAFLKERVEEYASQYLSQYQPPQPTQPTQPTQEEAARRQLQQMIEPFVKPDLDAAKLVAADSKDYIDFYHGNTVTADEKDAVEKMFTQLKDSGRPLPRRDIYDYLQGKLAREKPEEFTKRQTEKQKRQLDTASGAVDLGFSALDRAKNDPVWSNVRSMPLEELEKNLEGVTF